MKLIIRDTDNWEYTIYGVTLEKGITPTLNTLTDDQLQAFKIPDIESAVWFKILVIDSVSIDCANRSVTWFSCSKPVSSSDRPQENGLLRNKKRVKRISESTYLLSDDTQQTCTDLDEVFEETKQLIHTFKHAEVKSETKLTFYQDMFSVLHRHILPSITLTKEDVPQLEAAHEFQSSFIKKQNDLICEENVRKEQVENSQRNLRDQYYKEIASKKDGSSLNFPSEIAMLLYNHVQEDLSHFSQKLTETQTDVNLAKHAIQHHTVKTNQRNKEAQLSELKKLEDELYKFREKRNKVFERYKYLLQIRETLGEYVSDRVIVRKSSTKKISKKHIIRSKLKKISRSKRKTVDPRDNIYIELESQKEQKVRNTTSLVAEKVQMISVKEGIKSAIDELKTENVAYGVDFDFAGSFRATDVKKRPTLPENWLSLNERISLALEDQSLSVHKLHVSSSQRVIMQCTMFHKLHRKYLLSDPDSSDNISIDSTNISIDSNNVDNVFERTHLSVCSSLSSLSSADSGIRLNSIRKPPEKSKKGNQSGYSHRESSIYAESEPEGVESLICVTTARREAEENYTFERRQRYNSLVAFEESSDELNDMVIVHDTSPEYAHSTVDKIRHDIKSHMSQVCTELQRHLGKASRADYQRIWSSYERIYFAQIMFSLEKLYAVAYADVTTGLETSLPRLTPYTLAMDNQIILQLFEDIQPEEQSPIEEEDESEKYMTINSTMGAKHTIESPTVEEKCFGEDVLMAETCYREDRLVCNDDELQRDQDRVSNSDTDSGRGKSDTLEDKGVIESSITVSVTGEQDGIESQNNEALTNDTGILQETNPKESSPDKLGNVIEASNVSDKCLSKNSDIPCDSSTSQSDSIEKATSVLSTVLSTIQSDDTHDMSELNKESTTVRESKLQIETVVSSFPQDNSRSDDVPTKTTFESIEERAADAAAVELRRIGTTRDERKLKASKRSKIYSAPPGSCSPRDTRVMCPDALTAQVSTHMGFIEEQAVNHDKSSSDVNMNLAEQMIQNSTSGHLKQEVMRSTTAKAASECTTSSKTVPKCSTSSKTVPKCSTSSKLVHDTDGVPHFAHSDSHASENSDLDTTLNSTLDESFASIKVSNRSKYANVLDQINIDYARQVEKNIHVYYPISVNFWNQERNTWPLVGKEEGIEFASDAMLAQQSLKDGIQDSTSFTSRHTITGSESDAVSVFSQTSPEVMQLITSKSVRIQKPYLDQLKGVVKQLQALCKESTPTTKLQYAFKALHELGIQVKTFHTKLGGRSSQFAAPSADDLTDFLVVLLCNCDMSLVKSLYINVQIMRDYIPENLETGPYGFALMQLTICLHFLQERIVMQRGLVENDAARFSLSSRMF